jgi:hypothetical protein
MKVVFSSFDWVEAQTVAAMLEGSGLKPFIWGADSSRNNLFSTRPDVHVGVAEDQATEALALVEDFRKAKPLK